HAEDPEREDEDGDQCLDQHHALLLALVHGVQERVSPTGAAGSQRRTWPPGATTMDQQRTGPPARTQAPAAGFSIAIGPTPAVAAPMPLKRTMAAVARMVTRGVAPPPSWAAFMSIAGE